MKRLIASVGALVLMSALCCHCKPEPGPDPTTGRGNPGKITKPAEPV